MQDDERLTMVSACKFVDEVIPGCPYVMNREYLDYVIETYQVDYVVHGEDPCYVDGKDVYETAKQAGKFQTIPRTEGVSTTDIVGRMLLMTKEHHFDGSNASTGHKSSDASSMELLLGHQSKFLTTSRMLQLFSAGVKAPTKGMHVVYIDGAWDLFHPGHVSILKAAREVRNTYFTFIVLLSSLLSTNVCDSVRREGTT
jgi:ethanolamine-phosphate cytidylyltransferase